MNLGDSASSAAGFGCGDSSGDHATCTQEGDHIRYTMRRPIPESGLRPDNVTTQTFGLGSCHHHTHQADQVHQRTKLHRLTQYDAYVRKKCCTYTSSGLRASTTRPSQWMRQASAVVKGTKSYIKFKICFVEFGCLQRTTQFHNHGDPGIATWKTKSSTTPLRISSSDL